DPGETVTMTYTFRVEANQGIDMRNSTIVDHIDNSIFDLGDPPTADTTGSTYDGQALAAGDFELSINADGDLVIELSTSGPVARTSC
ncbi:MAG TPA: hypothetical protein PLV68_19115, partial [Ilumatobacteraceae bacterium]|nr:hypothetical protein [Ilumatobacteraceae bacterium]